MQIIEKNIIEIEEGVIVHQVNCQGAMGRGLAKQIKEKYPIVFESYRLHCSFSSLNKKNLLGKCIITKINDKLEIANLFGQYYYGCDRNKVYTSYQAFEKALKELKSDLKETYLREKNL